MKACFSESEAHLETWRTLLLASLDVSAVPTTTAQAVHTGLPHWFPEYSIDAYSNLITRHLPLARDKPCLKTFDKAGNSATYTYGEVDALVRVVVEKLNIPPGGKLAVIGGPSIETATLVLASAFLGCHHTVVIPALPPDSIAARLELFEPDLVITPTDWPGAGVTTRRTAQVATLRIAGHNVWINEALCVRGAPSVNARPQGRQSARYHASDALFSLFTSGSTGFPKGIVHGATGFLLYAHYTSNYFFGLGPDSTILCGAATGWINGHTYSIYAPLLHGATSILVEQPANLSMLQPLIDILIIARATILYLPVTTVRILRSISAMKSPPHLALPLTAIGTMGEMLAPSTEQWFSDFFSEGHLPVVNTYFQTETGGVLCAKQYNVSPGIQEGEIGPLPWFSSIRSRNGILELNDSVPGFMIDLMSSDRDNQIKKYFPSVSFCLHDFGRIKDGTLFCSGRSDDVINVRGSRMASGEIESQVLAVPNIMECAAVEFKNELELTDLRLFVVLGDRSILDDDSYPYQLLLQVTSLLKQKVSEFAVPGSFIFVESLPKTQSGKILRRLLRYLELGQHPKGMVLSLPEAMEIRILGSV